MNKNRWSSAARSRVRVIRHLIYQVRPLSFLPYPFPSPKSPSTPTSLLINSSQVLQLHQSFLPLTSVPLPTPPFHTSPSTLPYHPKTLSSFCKLAVETHSASTRLYWK